MTTFPKSFPLVFKDRLLDLFNQEVGEDLASALGDCEDVIETVRCMERLQQDDTEKRDHSLLLMREMEVKAREKSSSDEVIESIEILKGMQVDDIEKASRLILMAREIQNRVYEIYDFITKLRH
ncbi:hypothetical protein Tco_0788482 [Tanacetum coccineum]